MLKGHVHLYTCHCFFTSYYGLDCTQQLTSTLAHLFKTLNLILLFFFVFIDYSYFSHVFPLVVVFLLTFFLFLFVAFNLLFKE